MFSLQSYGPPMKTKRIATLKLKAHELIISIPKFLSFAFSSAVFMADAFSLRGALLYYQWSYW